MVRKTGTTQIPDPAKSHFLCHKNRPELLKFRILLSRPQKSFHLLQIRTIRWSISDFGSDCVCVCVYLKEGGSGWERVGLHLSKIQTRKP